MVSTATEPKEELTFPIRFVTPKQVAEWMGVSMYAVYKAIGRRELPACKINQIYKIDYDKFVAWVEAGGSLNNDSE